jgi:hypothetical protein
VSRSSLLLLALLCIAGCDGVSTDAVDADGGIPCLQPTVMPQLAASAGAAAGASVEVDLGEVATGPDPVVLSSVHLRSSTGEALGLVETARLSAVSGGAAPLLAVAGQPESEGRVLSLSPAAEVDLRGLASDGRVTLQLELTGSFAAGLSPMTLELCVTKVTPHGRL